MDSLKSKTKNWGLCSVFGFTEKKVEPKWLHPTLEPFGWRVITVNYPVMAGLIYRILPIIGASPNRGVPLRLGNQIFCWGTKLGLIPLIFDRFSIRNHHWKAQDPSFYSMVSDLVLLLRPAPLLGRIRYFKFSGAFIWTISSYFQL